MSSVKNKILGLILVKSGATAKYLGWYKSRVNIEIGMTQLFHDI